MSEYADIEPTNICSHCQAKQLGPSESCWLCHKPFRKSPVALPALTEVAPQTQEPENLSFSLATLFLIITLASVCMGLLVAVRGLGILACIIMVPVFFRTVRVVRRQEAMGQSVSPSQKVLMFSTSFAVTSVLVIVVCVSAFCSFCGVCLTIFGAGAGDGDTFAWGIGMCFGAALGFTLMVQIIRWRRRRYRRDMGEE